MCRKCNTEFKPYLALRGNIMNIKKTPNGNVLVEFKLMFTQQVYTKVEDIVNLTQKYDDLEHMISRILSRELAVYNGVQCFVDKLVAYVDDKMEGRTSNNEEE